MTCMLRAVVLVLAGAMTVQGACQADECQDVEESGLLQKKRDEHVVRSRPARGDDDDVGRCKAGGLGCNYTGMEGGIWLADCDTEELCESCEVPSSAADVPNVNNGTYWCPPGSYDTPGPTPAPTPYTGPVWQPGSKMCYIGACGCGPTYGKEFCNEPCNEYELNMDQPGQVCPNTKKATRLTNFCHASETNCVTKCSGSWCD